MNSKLTTQRAARYYGGDILDSSGDIYKLDASIMCEIEDGEQFRLLLTPLSAISDEHAVEVLEIVGYDAIGRVSVLKCYINLNNELRIDFRSYTYRTPLTVPIMRKLCEFGYDCDNAIEEGWAVDKTTFDNK